MFKWLALYREIWMIAGNSITWEDMLVYLGVASLSFVKFFMGVIAALLKDFSYLEVQLTAGLGAILGSWVFAYFGHEIRKWLEKKFNIRRKARSIAQARRVYRIWRKWGLTGIAALAPLISPHGSIGIAVSFRERPRKIAIYLTISIIIWTTIFTLLKETLLTILGKV